MALEFTNPDDLKQKTYYLAGKMSGLAQFNIPEFYRVAAELRALGHKIVNPAERDSPEVRDAALRSLTGAKSDLPKSESWGSIMGRDVELVIEEVDGLIVFSNWTESLGARIEVATAHIVGKPVKLLFVDRGGKVQIRDLEVVAIEEGIIG